jgi:hypothetical protein
VLNCFQLPFISWCPLRRSRLNTPCNPSSSSVFLPCSALWLACAPHRDMHRLIWDVVCLAAIHAFEHGRRVAWAVSQRMACLYMCWWSKWRCGRRLVLFDAIADFAATARVPRRHRIQLLTWQPFLAWHTVLRGDGLCGPQVIACVCICMSFVYPPNSCFICWRLLVHGVVGSLHVC